LSAAYLQRFGAEAGTWVGRCDEEVRSLDGALPDMQRDRAVMDSGRSLEAVESHPGADGVVRHYLMVRFPLAAGDGQRYLGCVGIDITTHKTVTDEMARLAVTDGLTGLYNRRGYMLLASHELKMARRRKTRSAVLFIDMDGLKQVNDSSGHGEGDSRLVETAALLRDEFRECDVIGRIGGDEFSVFAPDVGSDPERLKARLQRQIETFPGKARPPHPLSLSVGLSSCGASEGLTLEDLLAAADRDLYRDKHAKQQSDKRDWAAVVRKAMRGFE
jgi:diguanylate cyclase (GGDEF)-like protein